LGRGSGDCGRNLANKFGAGDLSISSIGVHPVPSHTVQLSHNSVVCSISNHRFWVLWQYIRKYLQSTGQEKIPAGGSSSGAVQGECVLPDGLEGCYWWQVWHTTTTHRLKTSSSSE
jgi:hypothetical protein